MGVTREDLAAFADGELDPARAAEVAAVLAADPVLSDELRAHRALRERLGAHFAPILQEAVPESLAAPLQPRTENVVSFAKAQEQRRSRPTSRWAWFAAPALAASVALVLSLPRGAGEGYAGDALAAVLDRQLVATQGAEADLRILLSFRDDTGAYCRAFAGARQSGIACRDDEGWRLRMSGAGVAAQVGDYRMAGTPAAKLLDRAQAMAAGPALDAAQERAARERGWR